MLYLFNLLLAVLAVGPLESLLSSVFDKSDTINTLAQRFDYNLVMDLYNHYGFGIGMTLSSIFSFLFCYIIWVIFASGGVLGMYHAAIEGEKTSVASFLKYGAVYFFRFFRLTFYILITYGSVLALFAYYFTKDGLDVFKMDSEIVLINRFWILCAALIVIGFFISIFRDNAKAHIVSNNSQFIFKSNLRAIKQLILPKFVLLSLLNLAMLGIVSLLYFGLKSIVTPTGIMLLLLTQFYLLIKLCYRVVREVSYLEMNR